MYHVVDYPLFPWLRWCSQRFTNGAPAVGGPVLADTLNGDDGDSRGGHEQRGSVLIERVARGVRGRVEAGPGITLTGTR